MNILIFINFIKQGDKTLHQKDNIKLLNALKRLRDLGNTVIVVEHDEEESMTNQHKVSSWCSSQWMFGNKRTSEETLFRCSESIPSD